MDKVRPTPNTEIEVSVLSATTSEHFNKIKAYLDGRNLDVSTHTSLDVNYNYDKNKVYRITIKRDIEGTLEPFAKNMSFKVFEGLLKADRPVINKVRVHSENPTKDIQLRVATETSVSARQLLQEIKLTRSDNKNFLFRLKTRTSAIVKDTNVWAIRVDMTKVSSGNSFKNASNATEEHEVEVELLFKKELQNIPDDAMNALLEEAHRIKALIQSKTTSPKATQRSLPKAASDDAKVDVTPMEWMLPNRTGFISWMYKTFHPSKYKNEGKATTSKAITLFPHQKLVRDYMQFESPYRGILLYHGLGVGKTCASIAAAEGFLTRHKKVYVMVPASLAQNYKNEILRCASIGNPQDKLWSVARVPDVRDHPSVQRIMEAYHLPWEFVKKHHDNLWFAHRVDGVTYSKENVSWDDMRSGQREQLIAYLKDFIETKYVFISYNGITKTALDKLGAAPFDDSFIVMDEAHNFISRASNGGKISKRIYNMLMEAKRSKMIFLSGTPVINHPYELSVLLNLVRGPMTLFALNILKTANVPQPSDIENELEQHDMMKYIDNIYIDKDGRKIYLDMFPHGFVRGDSAAHVKKERWHTDDTGMSEAIHKLLAAKFKLGKKIDKDSVYALPSNKDEFQKFFLDETDPNNPVVKNTDLFMRRILGVVSYFRTAGEEFFPTVLPRVVENVAMSEYQYANYVDVRDKERRMETNKRRQNAMNAGGLFGKKGTVYRAFSRMACNFVFPENVKRPFPKDLRKEISQNDEDVDANEEDAKVEDKDVKKRYDAKLKQALRDLTDKESQPLSLDKLRGLYSPKFAKIVDDINNSPGSCLLYSQFRTVEGLGIMRMVLEEAGYVEISVEKDAGREWVITDVDRVLAPEYDGKRFMVFNEDREKTDILIKIFNGNMADLPHSITAQLRHHRYEHNMYGKLARVFMISQSGAEGISLRNVRRVMIAEPFWNQVRIDQVIGRAIRTGSHLDLPEGDRNVQVFMYVSVFTPAQLANNFTLQRLDHSMSSDQHILSIAEHKNRIIQQFLDMMKRASFDCLSNASSNKMLANKMQCYAFPINIQYDELAFLPTLDEEKKKLMKTKLERKRKVQGRVVSKDGVKYVVVDDVPGVYDYNAYKDAGVLLPISKSI
jgi:hypothetical protein